MATAAQATPMKDLIFIILVLHNVGAARPAEEHNELAPLHVSRSKRIDQDYHSSRVSGCDICCQVDGCVRSGPHPIVTFAALMIGVQRAISLFTNAASGCWPRLSLPGMSPPRSEKRLRTCSSSSALSSASVSASRIGCGTPFGANNAHQGNA